MDAIDVTPHNYEEIVAWAPARTIRTRDIRGVWIIGAWCDELAEFADLLVEADCRVLVLPSQEGAA